MDMQMLSQHYSFAISFSTLILLVIVIFVRGNASSKSKSKSSRRRLPPGPWKLPFIGNMHQLIAGGGSLPQCVLRDLARKHGPLMLLQLGEIPTIVVSSSRLAEEVMKKHDLAFADRPEIVLGRTLFYDRNDILFAPYGDYWRQMRKICTTKLLSAKRVQSFSYIREQEISKLLDSIHSLAGMEQINLSEKIFSLTSTIICRAAFGKMWKEDVRLIMMIKEALSAAGGFGVADLFPSFKFLRMFDPTESKLRKIHKKLDDYFQHIVDEHQENMERSAGNNGNGEQGEEDLIDVMLKLKDGTSGDPDYSQLTNTRIKAIVMNIFAGGTETSSTLIEWAMSELVRNPRLMEKAQTELRETFKGKEKIYEKDIQGLKYLKLVIKEILRLHPPGPLLVPRQCREECEIGGFNIPVKTRVWVNAWAIGRDPDYWQDAENFKPERFYNNPVEFTGNHFEYLPFGAGRRICPGMALGIANIELPLANLLYYFNWKLPNDMKPHELDMTEVVGLAAGRKNPLCLIANPFNLSA